MVVWTSFVTNMQVSKSTLPLRNVSVKTYKYERVGMGKLVLDDLDNSHDASTDLFWSVAMIVGAYPQDYNLQQQKKKVYITKKMSLVVCGQCALK